MVAFEAIGGLPEPPTDPKSEAAPPTPVDEMKTKVMRRPVAPGPAMTPSPRPPAPPPVPQAPPPPVPRPVTPAPVEPPKFRYCPACTTANPPGASVCRGCGNPLGPSETAAVPKAPTQWGLYLAIGVAALLAIALIVVLIVK